MFSAIFRMFQRRSFCVSALRAARRPQKNNLHRALSIKKCTMCPFSSPRRSVCRKVAENAAVASVPAKLRPAHELFLLLPGPGDRTIQSRTRKIVHRCSLQQRKFVNKYQSVLNFPSNRAKDALYHKVYFRLLPRIATSLC